MTRATIYEHLAEHQQTNDDWELSTSVSELHRWVGVFCLEFKLQIPNVSLAVDRLSRRRLGQYRSGCNGFGLQREIIIARSHLHESERYELLGTLLHELLHAWQHLYGKPGRRNYHNAEFKKRAAHYGLIVGSTGTQEYAQSSLFFDLLRKHGVEIPSGLPEPTAEPVREKKRSHTSKLKLWMCPCEVRVRVARTPFLARCLKCNEQFSQVGE